ncbi:hypothetical protein [Streptomyces lichenis]|uniref:Molecular chaperone DnaJ n=1 Tax=Streptomyces lichenis TaxID=2306967 RepID=A0ABT0IFV8_9ACTN|nr:hypothetical protein [Streptomyces lichenis]MCK8680217.1 hypothetical protein [Streptomyces lichenis]
MATAKKPTSPRRRSTKPPTTPPCGTCSGTGETTTTVLVGRKRREIGATQSGLCPTCFGTGTA